MFKLIVRVTNKLVKENHHKMANEVITNTFEIQNHSSDIEADKQEKCSWNKFSESKLVALERKILNVLRSSYKGWFVNIDYPPNSQSKIWTISMNTESKNTPLVLLHGFGAAVGFWCLNLDALGERRPLYAIDLLGFGRSSRPEFSTDPQQAEQEIVESIEKWREKMALDNFILLGHSMGAYLASSYTINHPERVKHLILADPWGFVQKPADFNPSFWVKTLLVILYPFTLVNPLATVRAAGPIGPWIIKKMRSDIANKYATRLEDPHIISDYIYQCNSQKPTGETAFHSLIKGFGWAKYPMLDRANSIRPDIPITVLYGSDTWMDKTVGVKLKELRKDSYVNIEIIDQAGHHIHADNPESFNEIVCSICNSMENGFRIITQQRVFLTENEDDDEAEFRSTVND